MNVVVNLQEHVDRLHERVDSLQEGVVNLQEHVDSLHERVDSLRCESARTRWQPA